MKFREKAHHGSIHDFKTGQTAQVAATPEGFAAVIATFERELDQEILRRLVALNAVRAAEETAGTIRWLSPEYQNPTGVSTNQPGLSLKKGTKPKAKVSKAKIPWPTGSAS